MIEDDIFSTLALNTGISALVATRIYPTIAPETVTPSFIVYTRVTTNPVNSLVGTNALKNPLFQIDVYSRTHQQARSLGILIREAILAATPFSAVWRDTRDDYEPDTKLYRVSLDFSIWTKQS